VGLRRAEFEGQVNRLRDGPFLLASLAEVYARRHPEAPEMVTVQVVQRRYELADGLRTGNHTDVVVAEHDLEETP
jgi:hypothetical protein